MNPFFHETSRCCDISTIGDQHKVPIQLATASLKKPARILRSRILMVCIFVLCCNFIQPAQAQVNAADSLALVALYNSTNGPGWTNKTNWLTGRVSTWYGITVSNRRVYYLNLYSNNLNGTLPSALGNLTALQGLYLYENHLSGTIPAEIGNLTNLTELYLAYNQLSGSIPAGIGNLTALQGLYLYDNQLSGTIPASIGNLTNLTVLFLDSNQLSGSIPAVIGNLTNLTDLYLADNQFSGTIPAEIGNLTNLTMLFLASNHLSGSIPAGIGNLTSLRGLYLYYNQLSGTIPAEIGNLTNLTVLFLSSNQLSGSIPTCIGNLTALSALELQYNQLSGTIPASIGNLTNLTDLDLRSNQLSGSIPAGIGNLINLQGLWLNYNNLSGSIPASIVNLTKLYYLYLSNNQLSGQIPAGISNFTTLQYLYLNNNQFTNLPLLPASLANSATVNSNYFTFDDIIPNLSHINTYSPQGNIGQVKTVTATIGRTYSINLGIDSSLTTNVYKWYKDGVLYSTSSVNHLEFSSIELSDAGVYTCVITNAGAPLLTLTSNPVTVSVTSIPIPECVDMNYIRSGTVLKDSVFSERAIEALTSDDLQKTTTYFDGLGRQRQTVSWQASPTKQDIVVPVVYDDFGREDKKYLPYSKTGNNSGAFVCNDTIEQKDFYSGIYGDTDGSKAFSKTIFEPSPLNRVLRQGAPGSVWQPNDDDASDHSVKLAYGTNTANDNVRMWTIAANNTPICTAFYPFHSLFKTTTWDENNNSTSDVNHSEEYKDLQGKVVLKRSKNGSEILSTYYVYDDFGLLRWVLPPKLSVDGGSTMVAGISVSSVSASISADATVQLSATISPSNATNNNVTWSSDNISVATVDNTGLVTGITAGTATVTVTTQDGSKTATCIINVTLGDGSVIGLNTVGGVTENRDNGYWIANSFTAVSNITVNRMNIYVGNASGNARLGIYSSSSGQPGTLLAQTAEIPLSNGWNSGTLGSSQNLIAGATYWLAIEVNSSATTLYYNSASGRVKYKSYAYGSLPAPAPLDCESGGGIYSIYADYSGGGGSNIGLNSVGVITEIGDNGFWISNSFTAVSNITVNRMNIFVSNASGNARLGIYSSSSGQPGTLLAQTAEIPLSNGWNSGTLGSSQNLIAGATYWLAIEVNSSATTLYYNSASGGVKYKQYTFGSLPSSAPLNCDSGGGIYSIYADNSNGSTLVTGVIVSPPSATITVDAAQQLTATVSPSNATNRAVIWSSGNTSVAKVDDTGLVTGVAAGITTITVTTQDGSKTATSAITVLSGDGYTFGLNTVGGISENGVSDNWIASSFTAVSNITVNRMNIFVSNASGNARLGIYSSSSGEPGTLIAQTGEITLTNGWNSGMLGSPQNLTSGVTYWLVIEVNSLATMLHYNSSESRVRYKSNTYGSLPSSAPVGLTSSRAIYSIYADNSSGGDITSNALDELCYQYRYDSRKRMTEKKLPGVDWTYMVYDLRDRLVAVQDGVQRAKSPDEWTFTKYDALNRPIMTGVYTVADGTTQAAVQATVNGISVYSEDRLTTGYGYTSNSFPAGITEANILTLTYYDTYGFPGAKAFDNSVKVSDYSDGDATPYYFDQIKGQVTGTKVKVLDGTENNASGFRWLVSTSYYDDRYRVIQTLRDLFSTTTTDNEVVSIQYDFPGKVIRTQTRQVFLGNTNTVTETSSYDHAGRLKQVKHKVSSGTEATLASMEYNEIGQLKQKSLHGEVGNGIQNLNYSYNIRGWLEKINNPDVSPSANSTQKLNLGLYYNNVPTGMSATAQFNGNIAGLAWNVTAQTGTLFNGAKEGYGFTYDGLNRMSTSTYGEGTTFATNAGANNENLTYDKNGNILTLTRYKKGTGLIDNLTYTYKSSGASNMLDRVDDAVLGTNGFSELVKQANEYGYDGNGNLIKDYNKGYDSIQYNYLNLPKRVGTTSQYISYVYDAAGTKLAKVGTTGTYTYYAGSFVYSGSSLTYIMHREGMYLPDGSYQYYLKDHLGNTRLVVNTSGTGGTVVQQTDYYPFGMDIAVYNGGLDNKYRYNGKEIQEDVINGKSLQWYDYGARFYDSQIGRFHTQDRFAEKYCDLNPYQYAANNPILFVDINGDSIRVNSGGQSYYYGYREKTGYGMYDKSGQLYMGDDKTLNAVNGVLARLSLGKEGKALVDALEGSSQNVDFKITSGINQAVFSGRSMSIEWNPNSTALIPTQKGGQVSQSFISLGHEMGHVQDAINHTFNSNPWQTITDENTGNSYVIKNAELYSTHVENMLRAENGLPLRTHYGAYTDGSGISQTRLIKGNTSLYIQFNGSTNYQNVTNKSLRYVYK